MTRFNWAKLDAQHDTFFRFYRCPILPVVRPSLPLYRYLPFCCSKCNMTTPAPGSRTCGRVTYMNPL